MKWIGLTGGIATGKSTVSKMLRDLGLPVIDADTLSHEVIRKTSLGFEKVIQHFGREIIGDDGEIDRKKLGAIVFDDKKKLSELEAIVHPLVQEEKQRQRLQLEEQGVELAFYDVPLLFEKALQDHFDHTVLVYCNAEMQKERLCERDQLMESEIESRLASQWPIDDKLERADFVLKNEGSLVELKNQVNELLLKI